MARSQINDFLQVGRFHLLDVSFNIPPILLPVFGFKSITAPQLNVENASIKEGNYEYPRKVVKSASTSPITLEQGVSIFNGDFYNWIKRATLGEVGPKDLLLIQFTRINPVGGTGGGVFRTPEAGFFGTAFGNLEFATRVPGKAWYLQKCRPASYKAGTDFDGLSQEVSIATLDLEMEEFIEYNLGV